MNRKLLALLCCVLPAPLAQAVDSFLVKDIRVQGLQRITAGTLFNYLPVKVGDTFTEKLSQEAMRALFKTGFFKDVRLGRDGNVLVVDVVERPAIAAIRVEGSTEFKEEDLKKVFKEIGLVEGRVFNRSVLDRVEQELRSQYFSKSYYGVSIKTELKNLERNRVEIQINVIEGRTAIIRDINIVGNSAFDTKKLLGEFELEPAVWWTLWSSADKYSKQKLAGDLERLRQFYQDKGYLEFSVDSTQVTITPDKRNIYVTINISEGSKYTVSGVRLSGKFPVPEEELRTLVTVQPGSVFARKDVTETTKKISDRLADEGYAFANVNPIPEIDKEKSTVAFTFFVDAGKRVYVRRVNFSGNMATRDQVLRREMRQQEGAWFSASKVQRSRERIQRLPYMENVNVETPSVSGTSDQVDVNIAVKERPSGNLMVGLGYSDAEKVTFSASITESNLFGTGNELAANFDNSAATSRLVFRYTDPYYTPDGVSRQLFVSSQETDSAKAGTAAYNTKSISAGTLFGIPLSEDRSMVLGVGVERIAIINPPNPSNALTRFQDAYGDDNKVLQLTLGWANDTLDSSTAPSKGSFHKLNGEFTVPGSDLTYFKTTYSVGRYWPISETVSLKLKGQFGYGDGYGSTKELPYYKNSYAGGSSTVRGYAASSLGPQDYIPVPDPDGIGVGIPASTRLAPIGGDRRVLLNSELLFPLPGTDKMEKVMRFSLFLDGGMAYGYRTEPVRDTNGDPIVDDNGNITVKKIVRERTDLSELRYSTGLAFNWFSPVGPISLSYAIPLNARPGDSLERFQFTLGVPLQ